MLKKVLALALAGAMVLGSMSFSTAAATSSRTITITGLEGKDTVKLYKVLSWADDTDEADAHTTVSGWYPEAPFDTVLTEAVMKDAINNKNQLVMTDTLAGQLARALNGTSVEPVDTKTLGDTATTAEFTLVSDNETTGHLLTDTDGLYVAIITAHDQDVVYNPVFVHLDSNIANGEGDTFDIIESSSSYMNEGGGAAKKSRVTLTKESKNDADYTDTCDDPNTHADNGDTTKPGDVLTFTVTTTIPGYGDLYEKPYFNLSDTMKSLNLVDENGDYTATITVKDSDGTPITKVAAYPTITDLQSPDGDAGYYIEATATGYTIKFTPAYLKTLNVPTDIVIEYQAKVLEGANTNVIKEKNTVVVDFSHDPTSETDGQPGGPKQYKKDITNHYTFSIDANNLVGPTSDRIGTSGSEIIKVAVDKNGQPITSEWTWSNVEPPRTVGQQGPLAGAEFELLDKDKNSFNPKKTATSDASGRINFTGLDAGVYWLQETKAPAGYVKQSDPVQITISAEMEEREITEYYDQSGNWYDAPATGRTEFKYKVEELKSYTVTYGTQASKYTFEHAHEGGSDEIKWSIATSTEAPQSIVNTKGVELPSTGGIGTTLFYSAGAVLVLLAGVLLVSKRRIA